MTALESEITMATSSGTQVETPLKPGDAVVSRISYAPFRISVGDAGRVISVRGEHSYGNRALVRMNNGAFVAMPVSDLERVCGLRAAFMGGAPGQKARD